MILMGDYNLEPNEAIMFHFCQVYKSSERPSGIDLVVTNKPNSFLRSAVIEIGSSDFHKMTLAVIKKHTSQSKRQIS